jgi:peptidoglycan/LPS O-acetylase OafA/YrhL
MKTFVAFNRAFDGGIADAEGGACVLESQQHPSVFAYYVWHRRQHRFFLRHLHFGANRFPRTEILVGSVKLLLNFSGRRFCVSGVDAPLGNLYSSHCYCVAHRCLIRLRANCGGRDRFHGTGAGRTPHGTRPVAPLRQPAAQRLSGPRAARRARCTPLVCGLHPPPEIAQGAHVTKSLPLLPVRSYVRAGKKQYRADIQGLRAVAVLAVVLDHLLHWPSGGFVGVDIFFVISGFLITGLLMREWEKTGHISFVDFYKRRARRILPAALLVTLVTITVAWFVLSEGKSKTVLWDGLWAILFAANWRFASTGTDYFAQGGAPSPLQHYWSLSVEEQFYFVWPWIMLGVLLLVTRRGARTGGGRIPAAATIGLISLVSLAWAFFESQGAPAVAYFSSLSRAWELGVGAVLGLAAPMLGGIPRAVRSVLVWLGIAGMAASMFVISPTSVFPAPWALLPVLATALTIAAGTGAPAPGNVVLTNPVSTYVGDISYSLYLWHFPIIILGQSLLPEGGWIFNIVALAVMLAVSSASYHGLEKPITTSPWLKSFSSRLDRRAAWGRWRDHFGSQMKYVGTGAAVVGVAAMITPSVFAEMHPQAKSTGPSIPIPAPSGKTGAGSTAFSDTSTGRIQNALYKALQASSWPQLSPGVDTVMEKGEPEEVGMGCGLTKIDDPASCSFGDPAKPKIVLLGDSLGMTLMPTLRAAFEQDHHVRGLTATACAVTELDVVFKDENYKNNCLGLRSGAVDYINRVRPESVFVIQNYAWSAADKLASGATGDKAAAEWKAADETLVKKLAPSGSKIYFVSPPPEGKQLTECASKISRPSDCVSKIPPMWNVIHEVERKVTGSAYIDTLHWFCYEGWCPAFSGTTPVKRDFVHPTQQSARTLGEDFRSLVEAATS